MYKVKFKNSKNPIKVFSRLMSILFSTGILFLIGLQFDISPENFTYLNSVIYFSIIYALSYPIQYLFELLRVNHLHSSEISLMYSVNVEVLIWIIYSLLMPFTGDILA